MVGVLPTLEAFVAEGESEMEQLFIRVRRGCRWVLGVAWVAVMLGCQKIGGDHPVGYSISSDKYEY